MKNLSWTFAGCARNEANGKLHGNCVTSTWTTSFLLLRIRESHLPSGEKLYRLRLRGLRRRRRDFLLWDRIYCREEVDVKQNQYKNMCVILIWIIANGKVGTLKLAKFSTLFLAARFSVLFRKWPDRSWSSCFYCLHLAAAYCNTEPGIRYPCAQGIHYSLFLHFIQTQVVLPTASFENVLVADM